MKALAVTMMLAVMGGGRPIVNRPVVVQRGCGFGSCYAQPVAVVQHAQVYQTPLVAWQVGATQIGEERLRKVEEAIIVQQQLNAQLARIVSNGGAGTLSQSEVAVRRVFATNCLKCHNGPQGKGSLDLTMPEFSVWDTALISQMVSSGQMPPKGENQLSDADFQVIQTWAGERADDFRKEARRLRTGNGNGSNGVISPLEPRPIPPAPLPNGAQ